MRKNCFKTFVPSSMSNRASLSHFPSNVEDEEHDAIESNIHLTGALTIEALASTTSSPFQLLAIANINESSLDSCNNSDNTEMTPVKATLITVKSEMQRDFVG